MGVVAMMLTGALAAVDVDAGRQAPGAPAAEVTGMSGLADEAVDGGAVA